MDIDTKKFGAQAESVANLLKLLSNTHRLMILCRLQEGERSVGQLEDFVGLNQSALSQHLARLRHDGIVTTRRDARTIYYKIADDNTVRIIKELYTIYCKPSSKPKKGKNP